MWTRRKLIGTVATGAAGLGIMGQRGLAQNPAGSDEGKHNVMMKTCCDTCGDCAKACNKAFHHCLTQAAAGKPEHVRMAAIAADCAAFCALSAEMLARSSSLMIVSCRACADACHRCAAECASFDTDLDMKMCLQELQRCEESCRKMVQAMGADRTAEPRQPAAERSKSLRRP